MSDQYSQLESGGRRRDEPSFWDRVEHIRLPIMMVVGLMSVLCFVTASLPQSNPYAVPAALGSDKQDPPAAPEDRSKYPCISKDCTMVAGGMLSAMDRKADPCDDAYQFSCGRFLETFELPEDETSWTMSFNEINKRNRNTLKALLEEAKCDAKKEQCDPYDAMLAAVHTNCMDTEKMDREGAQPLLDLLKEELPWLQRSHRDLKDEAAFLEGKGAKRGKLLAERLSAFHLAGLSGFVGLGISPNTVHPELNNTFYVSQSGLGLDYDFYDREDAMSQKFQKSYVNHMANLFDLFAKATGPRPGNPAAQERAQAVLDLEFALRAIMLSPIEQRDPVKTSNPMPFKEVKALTGDDLHLGSYIRPWNQLIKPEKRVRDDTEMIVRSPEYLRKLAALLKGADWAVVHDYMLVRALRNFGSSLSAEWRSEFERYAFERSGAKPAPRWRRCLESSKAMMSWVLARRFINKAFDVQRKKLSEQILSDVRAAFREQIKEVKWMDEETRAKALDKEAKMGQKIGYPEWLLNDHETYFRDFYGEPNVAAVQKSWLAGQVHLDKMSTKHELSKVGEEADRAMWSMDPATVNAYYSPLMNEIVFPASILQPPFLYLPDANAQRMEVVAFTALNFGAYGAVVGHEITHGFDDKGSKYSPTGQLENWWTPASRQAFEQATQCVDEQYSAFTIEDGTHVKGKLTLGENIADNGGFRTSYRALKTLLTEEEMNAKPFPGLDLTTSQLYMLSFSQIWCNKSTLQTLRQRVAGDPHSPGMFRVQGVLSNSPQFAADFQCKAGQKLNPKDSDRCTVW